MGLQLQAVKLAQKLHPRQETVQEGVKNGKSDRPTPFFLLDTYRY
jgi:hypothetical protein